MLSLKLSSICAGKLPNVSESRWNSARSTQRKADGRNPDGHGRHGCKSSDVAPQERNDLWFLYISFFRPKNKIKIDKISILPDIFCIARFRHQAIRINSACLPPHRYLSTWFYMSPYVTLSILILSSHFELMLHSSQWPGFGRWKRLTPRCTGWASPQDEAQESRGAWGDVISEGVVHQ